MKKIIFIAILLYCSIVSLFFRQKPVIAQSCNCTFVNIDKCSIDDPSGCPDDFTPKITSCDNVTFMCLCSCFAPTPTPDPTICTCQVDYTTNSCAEEQSTCKPGEICQCEGKYDDFTGGILDCLPGKCSIAPTPIPTPTGADKYGDCDPLMTATGCTAINIKCDKGYKAVVSADCKSCWCEFGGGIDIHGDCGEDHIDTAIGCVPIKTANAFIKWFLGRAILLAGGIAFLMMIAGALMVIVSSGNPEKVKAGSQLITSAIAGLVFIIFSLFLLRLIGIEILQIPGL